MTPALITALTTSILAIIAAVTTAVVSIRGNKSITTAAMGVAHNLSLRSLASSVIEREKAGYVKEKATPMTSIAAAILGPATQLVYDCTGSKLGNFTLPSGVGIAGYDTGSSGIAWTTAQFAQHPDALHIDQDPSARDLKADALDSENGAVPVGSPEIATWAKEARTDFNSVVRPGQREPCIYQSASNVGANVNALIKGGITSGVHLWVANWNLSDAQAVQEVLSAAGPFPIAGVQYTDRGEFDLSEFSRAYLNKRSSLVGPVPPPVAGSGVQDGWRYCDKCGCLVWEHGGGNVCAAGGQHATNKSYSYDLNWKGLA